MRERRAWRTGEAFVGRFGERKRAVKDAAFQSKERFDRSFETVTPRD